MLICQKLQLATENLQNYVRFYFITVIRAMLSTFVSSREYQPGLNINSACHQQQHVTSIQNAYVNST